MEDAVKMPIFFFNQVLLYYVKTNEIQYRHYIHFSRNLEIKISPAIQGLQTSSFNYFTISFPLVRLENPATLPISHINLDLNDANMKGAALMASPPYSQNVKLKF